MTPPLPKPPAWLLGVAAVAWAVFTGAAALFGSDTWGARFGHDLLATAAGLALAVLGAGGLLRAWQQHQWRRRTQEIAYDLLDQAMRHTAVTASQALYVAGNPEAILEVDYAFGLPWTEQRNATAERLHEELAPNLMAFFGEGPGEMATSQQRAASPETDAVVERAVGAAPGLEERADKLRGLAFELGAYVEHDPLALATDAMKLHKAVRDLAGPLPGYHNVPRVAGAPLAGLSAATVLTASIEVARDLGHEYAALRRRPILNPTLRARIEQDEESVREEDQFNREMEEDRREFEALKRDLDKSADELRQGFEDLRRLLEDSGQDASTTQESSDQRRHGAHGDEADQDDGGGSEEQGEPREGMPPGPG